VLAREYQTTRGLRSRFVRPWSASESAFTRSNGSLFSRDKKPGARVQRRRPGPRALIRGWHQARLDVRAAGFPILQGTDNLLFCSMVVSRLFPENGGVARRPRDSVTPRAFHHADRRAALGYGPSATRISLPGHDRGAPLMPSRSSYTAIAGTCARREHHAARWDVVDARLRHSARIRLCLRAQELLPTSPGSHLVTSLLASK